MKNEKVKKLPYANKYVVMFIIFWLGVLTGALAILMIGGSSWETRSSILSPTLDTTSTSDSYQYYIPTLPGGIITIPTPPGGIINIPTPPGG